MHAVLACNACFLFQSLSPDAALVLQLMEPLQLAQRPLRPLNGAAAAAAATAAAAAAAAVFPAAGSRAAARAAAAAHLIEKFGRLRGGQLQADTAWNLMD